jgi:hypothetical protein
LLIRVDEFGVDRSRGGGRFEGRIVAPPLCGGSAAGVAGLGS